MLKLLCCLFFKERSVVMLKAGLIIIIFAIFGASVSPGAIVPCLFFLAIGGLLIYLKLTQQRRLDKRHKRKMIFNSKCRFSDSSFVFQLVQEFQMRNWSDLDFKSKGCQIFTDKIVTKNKTYLFRDFNLKNLGIDGCEELAFYLGEKFSDEYKVEPIEKTRACKVGSYSGYIGSSSNISISEDYASDTYIEGYKLYSLSTASENNAFQNLQDW